MTSIIILTYNNLEYTKRCIESIEKYSNDQEYEIIVVDNKSVDGTREYLKKKENIKVIYNEKNEGFPRGCNQGIMASQEKSDILLLNNDTVVTKNWLSNLQKCLNSSSSIGAVGAVCNQRENDQGEDLSYDDLEKMQLLAEKNNISDSRRWEEKVFLIGFCLLIKREVINKIKMLDEEYSPGYVEDNDLCLRISQLGYKLMLCHDCFIHHYLGTGFRKDLEQFYKILNKNRKYFYNKWHFKTEMFDKVKSASFPLIERPVKILEIDCGIGVGLLKLKYKYNCIVEGVEEDINMRKIAKKFSKVYRNLEEVEDEYDYILIGDKLANVLEVEEYLKKIKKYIKEEGYLIGEFKNMGSSDNIEKLLEGRSFPGERNNFGYKDIIDVLKKTGYLEPIFFKWYQSRERELEKLQEKYQHIKYNYFTFKAQIKKKET